MSTTREKLLKVIEAVEATPDGEFDMRYWESRRDCGTVRCAIGNYILRNPDCGLRFYYAGVSTADKQLEDFDAIASVFGITKDDALRLFGSIDYEPPTRETVIARIQEYVAALPATLTPE